MLKKLYRRTFENDYFNRFIYGLIILNVICVILETEPSLKSLSTLFKIIEILSVSIFTLEYILRLITIKHSTYKSPLKFILSPMGIIDILSIIPFYFPLFIAIDLRFVRVLRLFRLIRVFKIARYSKAMKTIKEVLIEAKSELILTLFISFILIVFSSSLMYFVEHDAQPEAFGSILQTFWWAIATLTTVGYGDVYPVTVLGKIISGVIAILGIGIVAIPTGIISSGFISKIKQKESTCPNCKEPL